MRSSLRRVPEAMEERFRVATPLRRLVNKVFPDHWSFLLGEIALYSFVFLILTGTFLALFFNPSAIETTYHGGYVPLRGLQMSGAFESTMRLSFDVRGGLLVRQMHHWSANLFMAAIVLHMLRIFFTGVFRKPRELNWLIGLSLFWLGFLEGFAGYSLPDDALSGTGLRIAYSIMLSIPVIGTWLAASLFGGEFPGTAILPRLYILHVLLVPALLVALISLHLLLLVKQKHTQFPQPGRTARNVVGVKMVPRFAMQSSGLALLVFAVPTALGGLTQINPVWLWGPYQAADVGANSQPDWYVLFLEGGLRLLPNVNVRMGHYSVPQPFWAGVALPAVLALLAFAVPWIERRRTGDKGRHELTERPRDAPKRTAIGALAVMFWLTLTFAGADDTIALALRLDLNTVIWAFRVAVLVLPPLAYVVAQRLALGLQLHDRRVLAEGIETGQVRMLPDGRYVEVHQPLDGTGTTGHFAPLRYHGWKVPKRVSEVVDGSQAAAKGFYVGIEPAKPTPVSTAGEPDRDH
jgi:ubiquinol-cytochrome c reductase cytochrome b subunit